MPLSSPDQFLLEMFQAAIRAADPAICLPPHLPPPPPGRTIVVGAGKAAAAMAAAVEQHWPGRLEGIVVTPYGHGAACNTIEVLEASHPIPDAAGMRAARRILASIDGLTPADLVLCLLSGGASALLTLPGGDLTISDKQKLNRALLHSGATISEMNCVRKHLSAIKGGWLACAAAPAKLVTLAISDVPGDDPSVIGSGPTVADPTTVTDANRILERYAIASPAVSKHLSTAAAETPKPGNPLLAGTDYRLIATPKHALLAGAELAHDAGCTPVLIGADLEGDADALAHAHADETRRCIASRRDDRPLVLLSGGETTVTVRGTGRGGRNGQYVLSLAIALQGTRNVFAIAADTDGIDGSGDNAGAIIRPDTLTRAAALGLDAIAARARNDSYSVFATLDDLIHTGPTRTNVNDFRAILIT